MNPDEKRAFIERVRKANDNYDPYRALRPAGAQAPDLSLRPASAQTPDSSPQPADTRATWNRDAAIREEFGTLERYAGWVAHEAKRKESSK